MSVVWRCAISAVVSVVLAFLPAFSVQPSPVFAVDEQLAVIAPEAGRVPEPEMSAPLAETELIPAAGVTPSKPAKSAKPAAPAKAPTPACPSWIAIGGNQICIEATKTTAGNPGRVVKNYRGQWGQDFLFAHNQKGLFDVLLRAKTFTITERGVTKHYRIVQTEISCDTGNRANTGAKRPHQCRADEPKLDMRKVIAHRGYDLSLMTCYGESLGAGDATHRFVAYANEI